jgi:Flp pilus assembly protein TadG
MSKKLIKVNTMKNTSLKQKLARNRKHGQKQLGQGVVEFALALPIMLVVIMGIVDFGRMMITYTAVASASREAARYGAAVGDDGDGTLAKFEDCVGIRETAQRVASSFIVVEDANVTIQYDRGPGTAFYANCAPDPDAVQLGDRVVVHISATFKPIFPIGFSEFDVISESRRTIVKEVVLQ